ncbi:MAG: UDP-glucose 4-epimerase [Chlamydiia bacterium]|nr:UDP-glucose 4-epimerase [Chlamydiia bacterium]MCH9616413.1 UDP-glucose 4-epimerase [Chlamydiia bacterium]MCH9629601.1 UDP-glucose 4-epimerase [Chlamydiia bacterium]
MQKVLITGGAGYVGTLLTNQLLEKGYSVVVYDTMFYGCVLEPHERLELVKADIRDTESFETAVNGCQTVIHLACISNDPSFHLDETLSTSINYDCFEPLVVSAKSQGVKRFIYASSSSVYGVSDAPNVTEDHPLVPLTLYNKYKGMCEPLLFKHQSDDFVCVTIRPATICGYSPRMRLDLSVNILTNHAVNRDKITVFGGDQLRPNLHIGDMCDLYEQLLELPDEKIAGETFNFGHQNYSISHIAEMVRKVVMEEFPEKGEIAIETQSSDDNRSYHICSDKIKNKLGISPKRTVEDAVRDLCKAFKAGKLKDSLTDESYSNVKTLMSCGVS